MNKLVSVVIPSYNHAHYIKRAIESVIDQTYTNWEILVVDNNSNDNTDEIVKSFNDKRIKLIKIQNCGIIASSRNKGIKESKGEYISFLDSDDWWYSNKLELSVKALERGSELVCHAEDWINNDKIFKTVKYGPNYKGSFRYLLYVNNCISTSAVTVKKDCLLRVDYFVEDQNAVGVEDYHLWLKLANAGYKISFIDSILGCYRVYNTSYSSNLLKQVKSEVWVLNNIFKSQPKISFSDYILIFLRFFVLYAKTSIRLLKKIIT